jgi:hypothetical protein
MSTYNSFIVRIWSNGGRALHGRIQHVTTREQRDFRDLTQVLEFIVERLHRTERRPDPLGTDDENQGQG